MPVWCMEHANKLSSVKLNTAKWLKSRPLLTKVIKSFCLFLFDNSFFFKISIFFYKFMKTETLIEETAINQWATWTKCVTLILCEAKTQRSACSASITVHFMKFIVWNRDSIYSPSPSCGTGGASELINFHRNQTGVNYSDWIHPE